MNDFPTDDARLDKTEAQMRRALGLTGDTPVRSTPHQSTIGGNGSHPQRRQFVRDGDVPVTIIHHQSGGESANQLDAARQAIRTQAAAREDAERLLEQAQSTIKDLQTKAGHAILARDEAIARTEADRKSLDPVVQSLRTELAAEKVAHERSEQALRDAQSTISSLTENLHGAQQALTTVKAELATERQKALDAVRRSVATPATDAPANGDAEIQTVRSPVGRPRKHPVVQTVEQPVRKPREQPVKWW